MSAPGNKSRWGSFLAGVEARLDNILADAEGQPGTEKEPKPAGAAATTTDTTTATTATAAAAVVPAPASPASPGPKPSPGPSRAASGSRVNDRLQERLARAMAAKAAAQKADAPSTPTSIAAQESPRQSLDVASRTSTESLDRTSQSLILPGSSSQRTSQDISRKSQDGASDTIPTDVEASAGKAATLEAEAVVNGDRPSTEETRTGTPAIQSEPAEPIEEPEPEPELPADPQEARIRELEKVSTELVLQHQEETHGYVERIDALEAKLQFLARETTDAARKAAIAAPAGSTEKKLAEKDQQIAQLMEEGKNLASNEQKLRTTIKKLRQKSTDDEKELNNLKIAKDKADRELANLRIRARRADELEKANNDLQIKLEQSNKELNSMRPELASKDSTVTDLRSQLQQAKQQAETLATKVNDEAREKDRRRIEELEESMAALQVEKTLVADRAKIQANELRDKAERAMERAKALELEMKAELQVVESKLELTRARAEEASSGATGDTQAKLLRQVETLQSQYSIASENWQGIETTLLSRIANLEKERDEAQQRESDMRKKAREAAMRARRNEEELEETRTRLPSIQEDAKSHQAEIELLQRRTEEAEAGLVEAKAEFERQRQAWKEEKQADKNDQDRRGGWLEDLPAVTPFKQNSRPASPSIPAPQRQFSTDFLGLQSLSSKGRKTSATSNNGDNNSGDRPFSRRPSAMPSRGSVPSGINTIGDASGLFSPTAESLIMTPSIHGLERSDTFDSLERSASPHQAAQDMVSVSTVAAGPSVQLVEKLSAAVRRLEGEKVGAREELARISKQRDDARGEIVALMREVEASKAAAKRVADLEAEVAEMSGRYETTLELLGEKSELVEELRADVQDVKAMYRDLVERTVR